MLQFTLKFTLKYAVNFNIFLDQSSCAFSWINERLDNTNMQGTTVKITRIIFFLCLFTFCVSDFLNYLVVIVIVVISINFSAFFRHITFDILIFTPPPPLPALPHPKCYAVFGLWFCKKRIFMYEAFTGQLTPTSRPM
jgi:hypothetical protein